MSTLRDFEGRVVIVTGGASGQGRAAAELFAKRGAKVVVADINETAAREVGEAIGGFGFKTDISKEADVKALVDETCGRYGGLDVLFNNAGIGLSATGRYKMTSVVETTEDSWDAIIAINLNGAAMACKHAIPHLIERGGGAIVNNASTAAILGFPGCDAYTVAKGGLVSLTRALAVEWGPRNIRTNCICPGPIETPMIAGALSDDSFRAAMIGNVPLGRIGKASEVASVAAFLASDAASYINGVILPVDGGWVAK
jgi:meso-butanediol dehydrogenase / (S,S)-butanediol dehydrogenase / diacetyl reductase